MSELMMKSIAELKGMKFYIPDYQRGYRWTKQQVEDLLDDVWEFSQKINNDAGIYCLQPLVVVKKQFDEKTLMKKIREAETLDEVKILVNENEKWEVVDGQQRLTTIRLILEALKKRSDIEDIDDEVKKRLKEQRYGIEYETREGSAKFLNNIANEDREKTDSNIDYFHMYAAFETIGSWLDNLEEEVTKEKENFLTALLDKVKFIWYEDQTKNAKDVFIRLNIGKISLTNAELIKALLLNGSNFGGAEVAQIRLSQQEIALEWDTMENALQSKEFWLFLNAPGNERPTRIDYIFNMVHQLGLLGDKDESGATDDFKTFRYFYNFLKNKGDDSRQERIQKIWDVVRDIFHTLQEWFDDMKLYHYVGYLLCLEISVDTIYKKWKETKSKSEFFYYLQDQIKKRIDIHQAEDLKTNVYDTDPKHPNYSGAKTKCRPILLLHNIETVIKQNETAKKEYGSGVFYKFPFHLYKSEKWDVEHIDSNTENELGDVKSQKEWLLYAHFGIQDEDLRNSIDALLKQYDDSSKQSNVDREKEFNTLNSQIEKKIGNGKLNADEKNRIWNFALLDSSTNRGYGNAIFPAKRRIIIGKDQGIKIDPLTKDNKESKEEEGASSAFIPPCTKYVFLKYYGKYSFNPNTWTKDDAKAYQDDIIEKLKPFLS